MDGNRFLLLMPAIVFYVDDIRLWLQSFITSITTYSKHALSCILGVKIISKRLTYNFREDIPFLIIAGITGSILNGLFNSLLMSDTFLSPHVLSFIFGDVLGQIALMLLFFQTLKFIDFNR